MDYHLFQWEDHSTTKSFSPITRKGVLYSTCIMCTLFKSLIPVERFLHESIHHLKKYDVKDA